MEVTDANSANFTGLLQLFHGTPGPVDIAIWLVNQVQVNVIKLQSIQRAFELGFGPFVTGILQPEFRGDKEFVTGDTALFQCVPDLDFILIRGGGVNQSITAVNSVNDRSFAFGGIGHLKYTKAQQGHFNTVVQFYFLHGVILPLSFMRSIT